MVRGYVVGAVESAVGLHGSRGSFVSRWALALVLLGGFYALALAFIWLIAYAGTVALPRRPALGAALMVAAFIVPVVRGIMFVHHSPGAPGERSLGTHEHPRLRATVDHIAQQLDTRSPERIVLVPGVAAGVRQRSSLLGTRCRELVLGLALLNGCSVDELRAVVAHELAHFTGGDARIDGLTARTGASIARTVQYLDDPISSRLFVLYGRLFTAVTGAVLRREELRADDVAATIIGPTAVAAALSQFQRVDTAFDELSGRFAPLARQGYYPEDLYLGLRSALTDPRWRTAFDRPHRQSEPLWGRAETHPSLAERLERLQRHPVSVTTASGHPEPARLLLDQPRAEEMRMSAALGSECARGVAVEALGWPAATTALWLLSRDRGDGSLSATRHRVASGQINPFLDALEARGPDSLAVALFADLNRVPESHRARVARNVIADHLYELVVWALLEGGHRCELTWPHGTEVTDHLGHAVPVAAWVRQAAENPATGVPAMRRRLKERSPPPPPARPIGVL